ncbi:MAG TPA: vanadium-dependent haloperoxidase [Candidatus Limnocylindrales bacterium]|nr:vanadium-dependent haloperoxidase [Candidatus Limnocylindrales bacterium]
MSVAGLGVLLILILTVATLAPASAAKPQDVPGTAALDWNLAAVNAVRAAHTTDGGPSRTLYQTEGLLYVSYVQAAVYDAAMKISNRYTLYHHFHARAGNASIRAAVISAAFNTLIAYLGDPDGSLNARFAADLPRPWDNWTSRGVDVGKAASDDIVALRANDGRNNPAIPDACSTDTTPGNWVCPPANTGSIQFEQTPWLAVMQPFMLRSDSQFRAPAPPALTDAQWIADRNETRDYGAKLSTVRSDEQTAIATFWNFNAINQSNRTLRDVAIQHGMDLVDTVRLLAMGNMVGTDAGIACFDSKYNYRFWRPITAIRADGLTADANWVPLFATPNHPEYPSQHGCVTSALAQTIARALGTSNIDVTVHGLAVAGATNTDPARTYATVDDIEMQLVNARVWIGFHYRHSVIAGENLGNSVAAWTLDRYFLPKTGGDD